MNDNIQIFPPEFEKITDFVVIKDLIKSFCNSQTGKKLGEQYIFHTNIEQIKLLHKPIQETVHILENGTNLPYIEFVDNRDDINLLRTSGWVLDADNLYELLLVFDILFILKQFVHKQQLTESSAIKQIIDEVPYYSDIHKEIKQIFDSKGNISDNASKDLNKIRQTIKQKLKEIDKRASLIFKQLKAQEILEGSASITIRSGRNVIPVPASAKYQVKGIIHDESATGQTVYIEPLEIVEMNNQLKETEAAEKREIRKILTNISSLLHPIIDDILKYYNILGEIDLTFAKAKFAKQHHAILPDIRDEAIINWKQSVNLVLQLSLKKQLKNFIPFSLELGNHNRMIILSGANAGGKSVVLKTLALNQYMIQCGLPVTIHADSKVGIFSKICIDIGDGQSFEANLSTYTSHLEKMSKFIQLADKKTLYLIDEIGTGTDPVLGGAMAQSILINLHSKGSCGIVTTHIDTLKEMADTTPEIQNAAMLFDTNKLEPSFQMKVGVPGNSFTFEIAARTGIPQKIIQEAKKFSGKERISLEERISDFEKISAELQQKMQEVSVAESFFSEIIQKYQNLIKQIETEQTHIIEKTKEEANALISNTHKIIENTIREIKEAEAEKNKTQKIRKNLSDFQAELTEFTPTKKLSEKLKKHLPKKKPDSHIKTKPQEYATGMFVKIKGNEKIGLIVEIIEKDVLKIAFDNIQMLVKADLVEYTSETPNLFQPNKNIRLKNDLLTRTKMFERNIDIRGMRANEAEELLEKHLDEAVLVGVKEFQILHGKGYGTLKQVVKKTLQLHPDVEEFYYEHVERGGEGITIVQMK